jgi:caa(3)-type oxidase subunit IV
VDVHFPVGVLDVDEGLVTEKKIRNAASAQPRKTQDREHFAKRREATTMHDAATHDDSKGQNFWVWGWLLVLTAIEVLLGYKQVFSPVRMLEVLLILSIIKSALIIGYFMHLKFEKALMRWLLVLSVTACFIIMYFFFFPDADRVQPPPNGVGVQTS